MRTKLIQYLMTSIFSITGGGIVLYKFVTEYHRFSYSTIISPRMAEQRDESEAVTNEVGEPKFYGDKYRTILKEEVENTHWRHGGPPIFDAVNKLFEEGRTKVVKLMNLKLNA